MNRSSATLLAATLLMSGIAHAATSCPVHSFISNDSFTLGDAATEQTFNCSEANYRVGDQVYGKLQGLVKAGQYQKADAELDRALSVNGADSPSGWHSNAQLCVRPKLKASFIALHEQMGMHRAKASELLRHPQDAIQTYTRFCRYDDAARVHLQMVKQVGLRPLREASAYEAAYAYSKAHPLDSFRNELRKIAAGYSDKYLHDEKAGYAAGLYNPRALEEAVNWLPYAGDTGSQKASIRVLAEQRGDAIGAKEGCVGVDAAIGYFEIAGKSKKIAQMKAKAMKLSETYERQGAYPAAARCYEAAGASDKAAAMQAKADERRHQSAAAKEKNEKARKKEFSKGQKDLENELGF